MKTALRVQCVCLALTWMGVGQALATTVNASSTLSKTANAPRFIERAATTETLSRLRQGGYTLYMRHGPTDNTRPDRTPNVDLNDCATQRPLTEAGKKLARKVGAAMRAAQIPIAQNIHISPLCRVKDTAAAAFPELGTNIDLNLMYTANLTDAQKQPIIANTRRLLSTPVASGTNRLVIAHAPNLMDLMGYFPKEATVVVFKPKGTDGFEYVASIVPGLWAQLLPASVLK